MNYVVHLLIMICIYSILGQSLNLLAGFTGLLSLSQAACYGIGAYVTSLLMISLGWNFAFSLSVGILCAMLLSLLVGVPSLRLKGDFFVLATLGFQMIVFAILYNWIDLTRGPYGIPGIPKPRIFGLSFLTPPTYLVLSFVMAAIVQLLCWRFATSPFGKVLQAIRDDEIAASALGKRVSAFKTQAFIITGGMAAIAGALFAGYFTYIDPTSFTLEESIFILTVVVVGGAGTLRGPVIGAIVLVLLPELLRFLHVPDAIAPNLRQIIYGLLLVVMMRLRPQGLAGRYAFD
jgi:branched-chain amino acid transport system permease protein